MTQLTLKNETNCPYHKKEILRSILKIYKPYHKEEIFRLVLKLRDLEKKPALNLNCIYYFQNIPRKKETFRKL